MSKLTNQDLFLGLDLSTSQLKAVAVRPNLTIAYEATVVFDTEYEDKYGISKGVVKTIKYGISQPIEMWLEAVDLVLSRLKDNGIDFVRVKSISAAGMQHGTVFWNKSADHLLDTLSPRSNLVEQLTARGSNVFGNVFTRLHSINWQDASTQEECDTFNKFLGNAEVLASITGSKAHHRFSGPQILRYRQQNPGLYRATSRISLVSSFLVSLFLGRVAPLDIGDVCGMNLWHIEKGDWHDGLLSLTAGTPDTTDIRRKLGEVAVDGGSILGTVGNYFVAKYGFNADCVVVPGTGDNLASILSSPMTTNDAMISLGTSTTFLMSTPEYKPNGAYHYMNHPTTPGQYMFMLCYKNGSLAREHVRDRLNDDLLSDSSEYAAFRKAHRTSDRWSCFNAAVTQQALLCCPDPRKPWYMGLYYAEPEIVPNVGAGEWNFRCMDHTGYRPTPTNAESADLTLYHPRMIVESQILALRLRSRDAYQHQPRNGPGFTDLPPQPRRTYLVGGASVNPAIAKVVGQVLGSTHGVYRHGFGDKGCALGAAYKALWAKQRGKNEPFEQFLAYRWEMTEFVTKVDDGYCQWTYDRYGDALRTFEEMENRVRKIMKSPDLLE